MEPIAAARIASFMPAHAESRSPADRRRWLGIGTALAAAMGLALSTVAWQRGEEPPLPRAGSELDPRKLQQLPARPEDVAAKPKAATSLLPRDAAQLANAAVPFAGTPLIAARPFAFRGSDADRARAVDCLATAVLYEAGDDRRGEAAVAQVVLNRVRHPAFPATVCGVVYQGSERTTGCQFTFTCDGSLARRQAEPAWDRARAVAREALAGKVDPSVGLATHYHTDWVYPYWSPSLRKLARVGSHLFFAWPGGWGEPRAFLRTYRGGEPAARTAEAVQEPSTPAFASAAAPTGAAGSQQVRSANGRPVPLYGTRVAVADFAARRFALAAGAGATAAQLVNAALALCQDPDFCRVEAWGQVEAVPSALPAPAAAEKDAIFLFERDSGGPATIRFDCRRFPNRNTALCF
jgi:spore germination cell wall hydrolase CwlJ-like protein